MSLFLAVVSFCMPLSYKCPLFAVAIHFSTRSNATITMTATNFFYFYIYCVPSTILRKLFFKRSLFLGMHIIMGVVGGCDTPKHFVRRPKNFLYKKRVGLQVNKKAHNLEKYTTLPNQKSERITETAGGDKTTYKSHFCVLHSVDPRTKI